MCIKVRFCLVMHVILPLIVLYVCFSLFCEQLRARLPGCHITGLWQNGVFSATVPVYDADVTVATMAEFGAVCAPSCFPHGPLPGSFRYVLFGAVWQRTFFNRYRCMVCARTRILCTMLCHRCRFRVHLCILFFRFRIRIPMSIILDIVAIMIMH
jgi:hypothetical protein